MDTDSHRPLVVSTNPRITDEVRRVAAATGSVSLHVADASAVRASWTAASGVVVGADRVGELAGLRLPRRGGTAVVTLTDPPDPETWRGAFALGVDQVLSLPRDRDRLADLLDGAAGAVAGALLCVVGGCGGAGASVLAAGLAVTARGYERSSLLVDGDPRGGGIDLLVGAEDATGLRWPDLAATSGRVGSTSLRELLPVVDGVSLLSWTRDEPVPVPAATVQTVLAAGRRGHELVVVDLPSRADDVAAEALAVATRTVLLVPTRVRAVAAARSRLGWLRRATPDLGLVVRETGGLDPEEVARALDLPVLATMRDERGLAGWIDQGLGPVRRPRGPLARACAATLAGCRLSAQGLTA